jgi:HAD superfamily hydrolase (TIGR01450 family)
VTNNPIRPPNAVAQRLAESGFRKPDPDLVITSALAAAQWLSEQKTGFRFFAVGADGLRAALEQAGGVADEVNADFVVVGEGPGLDYGTLTTGINLILRKGARLVATNPDHTVDAVHDGEHLVLPGCGTLVRPFIEATGKEPVIIGKPMPLLYRMAMARMKVAANDCVMIGDRPDPDITGAARLGMRTALVRTGRFPPGAPYPEDLPRPTWDVESLVELQTLLVNEIGNRPGQQRAQSPAQSD